MNPHTRDGDVHPLQGRWTRAQPFRWGGHVSPQFVRLVLLVHLVALGWFIQDWNRIRMLIYSFHEVEHEEDLNDPPSVLAESYGYREDPVSELADFRRLAAPIVEGQSSATGRAQALANFIYSMRRSDRGGFDEDIRFGPHFLLSKMQEGFHANCGQMSTVLATLWRSLGGHTRAVRWATHVGEIGHYAVELWDADREAWFYYDMNINGFAHDDDGVTPLSVAALRSNLLTGEDYHFTSAAGLRDLTPDEQRDVIVGHPVESYVLNNDYLAWSRGKRFGILNRYFDVLAGLPHPLDRVLDNLTGARDSRLIARGRIYVGGLFSFEGARIFVMYLVCASVFCVITLRRRPSVLRAGSSVPTAADTPPSQ